MFVSASEQNQLHLPQSAADCNSELDHATAELFKKQHLLQAVVESLIDGVMLVADDGKVLQANRCARQICRRLMSLSSTKTKSISIDSTVVALPEEIWRVCQASIESHELFPNRRVIPEMDVALDDSSIIRIRAQRFIWVLDQDDELDQPPQYVLVTLEDRNQTHQNRAIADALKFNLTPREGQIWQLRLQGYSYRAIASQLYITENTVKKHMKNILAKRQLVLAQEADAS